MKNNCIEFKVKQNESAHYNVQNHNFQDNVKYSIDIFETIKPANYICTFYSFTKIPLTYFGNVDTNPKRYINRVEPPRWKVIQKVMVDNNIKEVTVRLCPFEEKTNFKIEISTKPKVESKSKDKSNYLSKPPHGKAIEIENIEFSKNFKVVMVCAGGKNSSFFTAYPNEKFVNEPELGVVNEHHPDDIMNNWEISWRDYLINNQNDNNLLEAYNLYKREEYRCLHRKYKNNFYILSAGWGLVNSEYRLPNYNITFSSSSKKKNSIRKNKSIYKDFNQFCDENMVPLISPEEDIIYVGGKDYLKLFYQLTENLPNRKIIYFNSKNNPKPIFGNYLYRRYFINYSTNWHYELANEIANGIIP